MAREPFNRVWAENPAQFEEPDSTTWELGWEGGADKKPPSAAQENWWHNRVDIALRQLERNGAMEWLPDVPYATWALARGSDGVVYISVQDNEGFDPSIDDGSNWLSLTDFIKSVFNASGAAPVYAVRAWANFDGKTFDGAGIVSIRASGNIDRIERLSAGIYRVYFSINMDDQSYSVSASVVQDSDGWGALSDSINVFNYTESSFDIVTGTNTSDPAGQDCAVISFQVVR